MTKMQTSMEKLHVYGDKLYKYIASLRDVRNVGTLAFLVLVFLVSWSGVRAIQTNYGLQRQVYELQKTNDVRRLENANLSLTNDYYNTSQYLEVTARQTLGLAAPGETVLLVPKSVALAHTVATTATDKTALEVEDAKPFWQRNFDAWMDFFLNRSRS